MSNAFQNAARLARQRVPEYSGAVGDGTANDGAEIEAELATGRDLYLQAGRTYLVNGYTFEPAAGQRIYGPGKLKKTTIAAGGEQFFKIDGVDGVVIDGVTFEDTRTSGGRSYGVTIEGADNTEITNCRFIGYETPVFVWKLSTNTRITNNVMTGTGDFGIATGGDAAGNTNGAVERTTITGNYISNKTAEGIDINWDTQGCIVSGNTLVGNNTTAGEEEIDIGGGVCRDIIIEGNYIDGGGGSAWGIVVKLDTDRVRIVGNIIKGTLTGGIGNPAVAAGVSDIEIVENTIYGGGTATGAGIHGQLWSGFTISQNTISGFLGDGITMTNDNSNGVISGNRCYSCDDGIVCLAPSTVINGNRCYSNTNGINLQADWLTCTGNILFNNSGWGLVVTAGSDYAVITGNSIHDNRGGSAAQDGVTFTGASDRVLMTANVIYPVQATAVDGSGALTNSVTTGNITS